MTSIMPTLRIRMRGAAFRLLANARLRADIERYRSELDLIVLPAANPSGVQPTDFTHAQELLDAAYQAVSKMLHDERSPPFERRPRCQLYQ